ncbi:MAG: heavy-metal-associated domain-containing protein [Ignavibacteriales bacterium]|nr:heavy-metal-associated domain-containing protein [Ignavibacteriales bacterium]
MKTYQLNIAGMTCGHCVMSVKKELSKIPALNIKDVKIGSAVVEADESTIVKEKLLQAVEEAGYTVTSIQ